MISRKQIVKDFNKYDEELEGYTPRHESTYIAAAEEFIYKTEKRVWKQAINILLKEYGDISSARDYCEYLKDEGKRRGYIK